MAPNETPFVCRVFHGSSNSWFEADRGDDRRNQPRSSARLAVVAPPPAVRCARAHAAAVLEPGADPAEGEPPCDCYRRALRRTAAIAELSVVVPPPAVRAAGSGERARVAFPGGQRSERKPAGDRRGEGVVQRGSIAQLPIGVAPPAVGGSSTQTTGESTS